MCDIFNVTVILVTVAFAGIAEAVIVLVVPVALLSGTATGVVDVKVAVPGIGGGPAGPPVVNATPLIPGTPPHTKPSWRKQDRAGAAFTVNLTQLVVKAGST
ncbi:MAG: hypothetical protein WDM90_08875 [Ferruginibacter sp.]